MSNTVNPTRISATPALDVTTLLATPSSSVKIEGKKTGVIAKVPALVGKSIVQIYIDALAELDEPALEITNIRHDLNLTGCEFMREESAKNGKLLISGYIKQNIDYKSAKVADDGTMSIGNKRAAMNIPFKCFTKIQMASEPDATSSSLLAPEESGISSGVNGNNLYYASPNAELSFEVAETKIHQVNVKRNTDNITFNGFEEQVFSALSLNMAVDIALEILQYQYVEIPSSGNSGSNNDSSSKNGNGSSGSGGDSGKSNNNSGNNKGKKDSGKNKDDKKASNKSSYTSWYNNFSSFKKMFG